MTHVQGGLRMRVGAVLGIGALLLTAAFVTCPGLAWATAPAVPLAVAPQPVVPPTVTFSGAGWGHGVGLSQYGALGMAREGFNATQIVTHYYTGTTVAPVRDDGVLRVNLAYHATGAAFRTQALAAGGGLLRVQLTGLRPVLLRPTDTLLVARAAGTLRAVRVAATGARTLLGSAAGINLRWSGTTGSGGAGTIPSVLNVSRTAAGLAAAGHRYRYGSVNLIASIGSTTTFEVVNYLRIHDEYLLGIAEVPSSWPQAALQAQVIAARSYALSKANAVRQACRCNVDNGAGPYYDQTFAGYAKESGAAGGNWRAAVLATAASSITGTAVLYAGKPIAAFYTSATGGRTQSSKDVWGGALPWAVSVDDHWSLDPTVTAWAVWNPRVRSQATLAAVFGLPNVVSLDLSNRLVSGALATATATSSTGLRRTVGGYTFAHGMSLPSLWMWRAQVPMSADPVNAAIPIAQARVSSGVVIASSDETATVDAAVGASFASALSLPFLLTPSAGALAPATLAALTRRPPRVVYLVGTSAQAPAAIVNQLLAINPKVLVRRVSGDTPSDVSMSAAHWLAAAPGAPIVVASATEPATVLSAAAAAGILRRPLILLPDTSAPVPALLDAYVAARRPLIVGSPTAVPDAVGASWTGASRVTGGDVADLSANVVAMLPAASRSVLTLADLAGPRAPALAAVAGGYPVLWTGPVLLPSALALLQTTWTSTIRIAGAVPATAVWSARRA